MEHPFDKEYWDEIWQGDRAVSMAAGRTNPHLIREVGGLAPGTALEAGCGAGAEAIWLAERGWHVTAADIADEALAIAADRAATAGVTDRVQWVRADLAAWEPEGEYDLVTTHYAHPAMPQLDFYRRIASWVVPGGTLLLVGHLHQEEPGSTTGHGHGAGHSDHGDGGPPASASATADSITALLPDTWRIETAQELHRTSTGPGGEATTIHDVVVRATRLK